MDIRSSPVLPEPVPVPLLPEPVPVPVLPEPRLSMRSVMRSSRDSVVSDTTPMAIRMPCRLSASVPRFVPPSWFMAAAIWLYAEARAVSSLSRSDPLPLSKLSVRPTCPYASIMVLLTVSYDTQMSCCSPERKKCMWAYSDMPSSQLITILSIYTTTSVEASVPPAELAVPSAEPAEPSAAVPYTVTVTVPDRPMLLPSTTAMSSSMSFTISSASA